MSRTKIAAGNWKMNTTYTEGLALAEAITAGVPSSEHLVILGVPFTHLQGVSAVIKDKSNLKLAAQNCYYEESGAYTGEISLPMLQSVGTDYVILGHSERRQYFDETDAIIAKKVDAVLQHDLLPIYCCGEILQIREAGNHVKHVAGQVKEALFHLSAEDFSKVVIAYEPVWAIGTGKTASPEQAQEMHHEIRSMIAEKYNEEIADSTTILYGGSVKPANAKELFSQTDVDGGLVGGASLKAETFLPIVEAL